MSTDERDAAPALVFLRGVAIPNPAAVRRVDSERREINAILVVVGSGADRILTHLYQTAASAEEKQAVDVTVPGEPSYAYVPLRLGDIRGFKVYFHLYGFGSDERLLPMMTDLLQHAGGVIVAQGGPERCDVVRAAANQLASGRRTIPVAVLGPAEVAREWERDYAPPTFVASLAEDNARTALRETAAVFLRGLRAEPNDGRARRTDSARGGGRPWWKFW